MLRQCTSIVYILCNQVCSNLIQKFIKEDKNISTILNAVETAWQAGSYSKAVRVKKTNHSDQIGEFEGHLGCHLELPSWIRVKSTVHNSDRSSSAGITIPVYILVPLSARGSEEACCLNQSDRSVILPVIKLKWVAVNAENLKIFTCVTQENLKHKSSKINCKRSTNHNVPTFDIRNLKKCHSQLNSIPSKMLIHVLLEQIPYERAIQFKLLG